MVLTLNDIAVCFIVAQHPSSQISWRYLCFSSNFQWVLSAFVTYIAIFTSSLSSHFRVIFLEDKFRRFFLNQLGMKFTLPCKWTNSYWCASCMSLELKKIFSFLRLVCIDISNGQEDICIPTANVIDIHLLHLQASSTI